MHGNLVREDHRITMSKAYRTGNRANGGNWYPKWVQEHNNRRVCLSTREEISIVLCITWHGTLTLSSKLYTRGGSSIFTGNVCVVATARARFLGGFIHFLSSELTCPLFRPAKPQVFLRSTTLRECNKPQEVTTQRISGYRYAIQHL